MFVYLDSARKSTAIFIYRGKQLVYVRVAYEGYTLHNIILDLYVSTCCVCTGDKSVSTIVCSLICVITRVSLLFYLLVYYIYSLR